MPSSPESRRYDRVRFLIGAWAGLVLIDFGLRAWLVVREGVAGSLLSIAGVLAGGTAIDVAVDLILLAPLGVAIALGSGRWLRHARVRYGLYGLVFAAAIFRAFVESAYFDEFDARFNHIALDYLLYPGEVATNIWESYSVPAYVTAAVLLGGAMAWLAERGNRGARFDAQSWPRRARAVACGLALVGASCFALAWTPRLSFGDRQTDELAANGSVELVRAFHTASLPYTSYYKTVPEERLRDCVRRDLGDTPPGDPARAFQAVERRDKPLDVVVILGESFGSEFVGCLHGDRPCTPGFDRWSSEGLLLSNVVPTGNRTVRGLEGVLCSFVPLPGDSIWKRDKSDGVASIASVLGRQGYRTEFLYGGAGAFDSMRSFALRNGWGNFVEDGLVGGSAYPEDAFRTAWGVADEYLFKELLQRQHAAARDGVPYFATALTTSNHKPFLTPDSAMHPTRHKDVVAAIPWVLGLLLVSFIAWRALASRVGRVRLGVVMILAALVMVASWWTSGQPRDTREAAVRYSDRALAEYLDAAKAEGLFDHTIVLFVGDHGARVYGAGEIPAESYRVPALFLAPEAKYHGQTIARLCSQVDLAPTLLSLAGVDYSAPFFGEDLLKQPKDGPGRAWLIHNRSIGLLTDRSMLVLGLQKSASLYEREGRESDALSPVPPGQAEDLLHEMTDRAAGVFQLASTLYESGRYRLLDAPR